MLVGVSAQHGNIPAVLLGGRFYTGKQSYRYTDFGGGVDRKKGETPQQGAFREFAEELLSQTEDDAKVTAGKLCESTRSALVGGRPFMHKGAYAMFIVDAESLIEALNLRATVDGDSAIDSLFASATLNSELTSVALVSIEELLMGALGEGIVRPLSVRQLDGADRASDQIQLRQLLVGNGGSLITIRDTLERFAMEPARVKQLLTLQDVEARRLESAAKNGEKSNSDEQSSSVESQMLENTSSAASKKRRWGRKQGYPEAPLPEGRTESSASGSRKTNATRERRRPTPYVFDMETGDPDDVLTLLFLCSHPDVDLRAVTITPGTSEQVALVRWLLTQVGMTHIRLGAQAWPANADKKVNLQTVFYDSFGRLYSGEPSCESADRVLLECCNESTTLLTGGPLHNLGAALKLHEFRLGRWVAQGGFAGEGVVPSHLQMDKFKGQYVCSTWNFCGNIPAAEAALASAAISRKICVSKNVCHSVVYDDDWHAALGAAACAEEKNDSRSRRAIAFRMMYKSMDAYLRRKPDGKKLHDPLALAVALDESVCTVAEVNLFCQKGKWGSKLCPGRGVWISIAYDNTKFQTVLLH
eukprot:TRINITY_DN9369_c0_g3_i2.p1 TRINITY_DN9369_c0_g3~~TRINITY_DN9369_c0_g3_i2.p1  ORF type:complete len:631 (-),score=69.55 TRINITY_DN9369_c0_g3_i2:82-1842(-)